AQFAAKVGDIRQHVDTRRIEVERASGNQVKRQTSRNRNCRIAVDCCVSEPTSGEVIRRQLERARPGKSRVVRNYNGCGLPHEFDGWTEVVDCTRTLRDRR